MLQKIKLQKDGKITEMPFIPDSAAFDAARTAGDIKPGMEIIYKANVVQVMEDYGLLVIGALPVPQFVRSF